MNTYQTKALNEQTRWNSWGQLITAIPTFDHRCRFILAAKVFEQLGTVFTKREYEKVRRSLVHGMVPTVAPSLEWVRSVGLIECVRTEKITIERNGQTFEAQRHYYAVVDSFKQDIASEHWGLDVWMLRNRLNVELRTAQAKVDKMKTMLKAIS